MHESDVVVGADDVAEGGKALFDALDLDAVGNAVSQMLQLLVGGRGRDQQAFAVTGGEAADDAGAGDGGVADGDHILELGFEDAVGEWISRVGFGWRMRARNLCLGNFLPVEVL